MNKQIGFYCPFMDNTDIKTNIRNTLNDISDEYNTIMFNSKYDVLDGSPRKYSILHCNQARYFYGAVLSFDIDAISIVNTFPAPSKKVFIASDIYWQNKNMSASVWSRLIPDEVEVITHDARIYDLYSICFKKPAYNMENGLNGEELKYVLREVLKLN